MTEIDKERVAACQDAMIHLDKAIRVFRMYARGNDMVTRFTTEVIAKMSAFTGKYGEIAVAVRPAAFEHEGVRLTGQGLDELALALFRQGLTSLRFGADFTREGLLELLALIQSGLQNTEVIDDDLVTLLWRSPVPGMSYTSVLAFHEEGADAGDVIDPELVRALLEEEQSSQRYRAILQRASATEPPGELFSELALLGEETEKDIEPALFEMVAEAWFQPQALAAMVPHEARTLLELPLRRLLDKGALGPLVEYGRFLNRIEKQKEFPFREQIVKVMSETMTDADLRRMVGELEGGPEANALGFVRTVQLLGARLRGTIADLADETEVLPRREMYEQILLDLCKEDPGFLAERMAKAKSGPAAVRMLLLLSQIDLPRAKAALLERLRAADADALPALVKTLATNRGLYGDETRTLLIARAEEGGRVRLAVVEAVRALQDNKVIESLWSWVGSKSFKSWPGAEAQAVLRTLVVLAPKEALEHIGKKLGKSVWFGKQALYEQQAAAARALGISDSPEAKKLLQAHAEAEAEQVRMACSAAIGEIDERARTRQPAAS